MPSIEATLSPDFVIRNCLLYTSIQAVVELLQEMELEKEVICGKVQEKFHISSQEAAQEVEKYWK